jgi:hypothetical protein
MRPMRSSLIALVMAAAPCVALAQGLGDASLAAIPQYVSIKIGTGASAKTVTQFSMPLVVVVPITSRFNIDVATAYATSEVSTNGAASSSINGLTDTQVRANLTLGNDAVVFTVGANIPTGQYTIPENQAEAAGQIGNDFLLFPVSSYGSGLSGTGGIAAARSLGNWNLGVATSFRKSTEFNAFNISNKTFTFTPADEVRARVGLDRMVGNGRLTFGVSYSAFGNDIADSTSYATGDRYIGQASLFMPLGSTDLYLSGWNLYRAKGQQLGGASDPENIASGSVALGFHLGNLLIEPSIEGRSWQDNGIKAGQLANAGLRLRFGAGPFTIMPNATYHMGKVYSTLDGSGIDVTGWRASLMIRLH